MQKNISVLILAAGKSSRMGFPKLTLKLPDGQTFLEHIISQYEKFGVDEIIVVVNDDNKIAIDKRILENNNVTPVINQHLEYGRFYSIKIGMDAFKAKNPVFIHNVDNPFADLKTLSKLYCNRNNADVVKPTYKRKGGHPILISKNVVKDVTLGKDFSTPFNKFLKSYSCLKVEVENKKILLNINTLEDYNSNKDSIH